MNTYPVGTQVICRFAFTTRALTSAELAAFIAGNGLPAAIGIAPTVIDFDYEPPGDSAQTLTGTDISTDATGAYHVTLPIVQEGLWSYRARGTDSRGDPVACTPDQTFRAVRSF